MSDSNYCSILTAQSGEPLAGTAPFAKHFVFITWPKKYWQYEALESKGGFPQELKKWMKEQSKINGKISIRLASRSRLSHNKVDIFIYPERLCYSNILPSDIHTVLESHFQLGKTFANRATKIEHDQIFICTHGRHDKCCAKFGQELVDNMRDHVLKEKDSVEVWESSHLGGHRFAATMIDFPLGRAYGRLTPDNIPDFFARRKTGHVFGSAYRGSVFLSELEQIAEAHVQNFCSVQDWPCKVQINSIEKINELRFRCNALFSSSKSKDLTQNNFPDQQSFTFRVRDFESHSSCKDNEVPKLRKCWELEPAVSANNIL